MSQFASPSDVYRTIGALFTAMVSSNGVGASLRALDTTVLLAVTDPTAWVTLRLKGASSDVVLGSRLTGIDIELGLSATTVHEILLGEGNPYAAVGSGDISVRGPVGPFMVVVPKIQFAAPPVYRALLDEPSRYLDEAGRE